MTLPTSPLLCPRCQEMLFLGQASGVDLHACGHCGGLWIDNASAQRICSAVPEDALSLADSAARHATGVTDTSGAVACPVCSAPCRRTPVASARADIDLCDQHGTWFDRGELRQITWALKNSRPRSAAPAVAAGLGAVGLGVAGVAAVAAMNSPHQHPASTFDMIGEGVEVLATGVEVVEVGADMVELGGAVVEGAGALMEGAGAAAEGGAALAEGAGAIAEVLGGVAEVAGGVFEVLGGIFSILG